MHSFARHFIDRQAASFIHVASSMLIKCVRAIEQSPACRALVAVAAQFRLAHSTLTNLTTRAYFQNPSWISTDAEKRASALE